MGRRTSGASPALVPGLSLRWLALCVAIACGLVTSVVSVATAQESAPPASCPAQPAPYAGNDPVVNELRAARADAQETCVALRDSITAVGALVGDVDANVSGGRNFSDQVPAKLDVIHEDLTAEEQPTTQTVSMSESDRELLIDGQLGIHSALWVLAGLLVGGFAATRVWEVFRP